MGAQARIMSYLDGLRSSTYRSRGIASPNRAVHPHHGFATAPSPAHHSPEQYFQPMPHSRDWHAHTAAFNNNVDLESLQIGHVAPVDRLRLQQDRDARHAIEQRIQQESERRQTQRMQQFAPKKPTFDAPGPPQPVHHQPVQFASGSYLDNLMSHARSQHVHRSSYGSSCMNEAAQQHSAPISPPRAKQDDIDVQELKAKMDMTEPVGSAVQPTTDSSFPSTKQHTVAAPVVASLPAVRQHSSPVEVVPESTPERMDRDRHARLRALQARVSSFEPLQGPTCSVVNMSAEQLSAVIQSSPTASEISALVEPPRSSNIMRLRAELEQLKQENRQPEE